MSGRFDNLVGELPDGNEKDSILAALNSSTISSEAALRVIIRGRNIEQVTSLFERKLDSMNFLLLHWRDSLCQVGKKNTHLSRPILTQLIIPSIPTSAVFIAHC